jgi:hypothetical protein
MPLKLNDSMPNLYFFYSFAIGSTLTIMESKSIVQELLTKLALRGRNGESTKSKQRKGRLVLINQLQHFLKEKPFELNYIQTKIENLIHKWYIEVFGRL